MWNWLRLQIALVLVAHFSNFQILAMTDFINAKINTWLWRCFPSSCGSIDFSEVKSVLACFELKTVFPFTTWMDKYHSFSLSVVECDPLASFRFEDEDKNEDQVQLLLVVRMLKSVTVMAWRCCCNQLRRPGLVEDEKVWRFCCGENRVLRPRPRI